MEKQMYDMIIVGAGPAGLSAAIYMARAKYRVLVLEKEQIGGQITITEEIVNYPGILSTTGKALTESMREQAEAFGAEFAFAEVKDMELESDMKKIHTGKGDYEAVSVVLAVGANPRRLGFKGEQEFQGRGVAYCATCDGEFFTGMNVFVLGGGFAAVEEGMFLTKYAKKVTLLVRRGEFSCAKTVSDKLKNVKNIDVRFHTELQELTGNAMPERAVLKDNQTEEITVYDAEKEGPFGVFVFAGYVPDTKWLPESVELNGQGYIVTDINQQTNIAGVFGAGDVCVKNLRQVVTAVSDGAIAATAAEKHVAEVRERLGLPDFVRPETASKKESAAAGAGRKAGGGKDGFFDGQMRVQLGSVFEKFAAPVLLKAWLDGSSLSEEMKGFLQEVASMTEKVRWEVQEETPGSNPPEIMPSIEVCRADGTRCGIHFHGVPGGHEINSFLMAMYNVAGPGREIEELLVEQIQEIRTQTNLKILVSLSCTMCPETVMSAQKIASLSGYVEAEMIDIAHFPELKEKYKVMSVPCMVVNDSKVVFGKKNVQEVVDIIAGESVK